MIKQPVGEISLDNKTFLIFKSINEVQTDELFYFAQNDPLVKRNTSDSERFNNRSLFREWLKEKTIYTLSDQAQSSLGGIIWLEKKEIPARSNLDPKDYEMTIAMRVYGQLRGHHLALPFGQAALKDFLQDSVNSKLRGIWLQTSFDNEPLKKTFSQLGFEKIGEQNERGKILMVARVTDIRNHRTN